MTYRDMAIMANELSEVEQILSQSAALVINIGTANERTLAAMLRAGWHYIFTGCRCFYE